MRCDCRRDGKSGVAWDPAPARFRRRWMSGIGAKRVAWAEEAEGRPWEQLRKLLQSFIRLVLAAIPPPPSFQSCVVSPFPSQFFTAQYGRNFCLHRSHATPLYLSIPHAAGIDYLARNHLVGASKYFAGSTACKLFSASTHSDALLGTRQLQHTSHSVSKRDTQAHQDASGADATTRWSRRLI